MSDKSGRQEGEDGESLAWTTSYYELYKYTGVEERRIDLGLTSTLCVLWVKKTFNS